MAPVGQSDNDAIESKCHAKRLHIQTKLTMTTEQLKDVLQDLYQMMIQVNNYDTTTRPSKDILDNSVYAAPILFFPSPPLHWTLLTHHPANNFTALF
jgi:hypothetical protein